MSAQAPSNMTSRHSKKGAWPTASPTYPSDLHAGKPVDATALDPSAAAIAASSHLTASLNDGRAPTASPNPALPSPTSPGYRDQATSRYPREPPSTTRGGNFQYEDLPYLPHNASTSGASLGPDSSSSTHRPTAPTPTPGRTRPSRDDDTPQSARPDGSGSGQSSTPSVEIFKSFRVSMDDPCYKVLPAALKKYNINADWRQYALYIVYGDQERCLGLEEKPLILFKQLDREGRKPMFMLRRHAAPLEGHSGPSGGGGMPPVISNFERGGGQIQLPGGVL
jgi:protein STE50